MQFMSKFKLLWRLDSSNIFLIILVSTEDKVDCQTGCYNPVVTQIFAPQIIVNLRNFSQSTLSIFLDHFFI